MSKRKSKQQKPRPPVRAIQRHLDRAEELLADGELSEARNLLEDLARQNPNRFEVQWQLFSVYQLMNDRQAMLRPAIRLVELRPNDPTLRLNLAGVYMMNVLPALAIHTFQEFLARWPHHEEAAGVQKTIAELREALAQATAEEGITLAGNEDRILMHEQIQACLSTGRLDEGRRLIEELLAQWPTFAPPLNNLSLSYFLEGRIDEAIAASRRVLEECDPNNYHALSNLIHYLVMAGRISEAQPLAGRLKAVQSDRVDVWLKKAEGLSYLGDDAGVEEVFRGAEAAGMLERPFTDPYLFHLAAVAAARRGDEGEARRRWQRALRHSPGFELAQENLADLARPVGERHGAWPFSLVQWLPRRDLEDLVKTIEPVFKRRSDEAAVNRAMRQFLDRHPGFENLIPLLLARGDPQGREFAFRIAQILKTPTSLSALRDFALSQNGPDQMRLEAAQAAAEAGLLPRGKPIRMWVEGKWHDQIALFGWAVSSEPKGRLPGRTQRLIDQAVPAIQEGRLDEAERLLEQALALAPDHPSILQNLAAIYSRRGDNDRAIALTREIVERHPDYIIGRCNLALSAAQRGDVDEARRWLEPVLDTPEFHTSEFTILCRAQIEIALAEGQNESARTWIHLWEQVDPDNPLLDQERLRVKRAALLQDRLRRLRRRRGRRGHPAQP